MTAPHTAQLQRRRVGDKCASQHNNRAPDGARRRGRTLAVAPPAPRRGGPTRISAVKLRRHRGGTLKWLPTQLPAPVRSNRAHRWRRARRPRTAPSSMSRAAAGATTCPGPARPRAPPHPLPPISPHAGRAPPDRGPRRPNRCADPPAPWPRVSHPAPAPPPRPRAGAAPHRFGRPRKQLPRPCQI